jgi:hypothetical protein
LGSVAGAGDLGGALSAGLEPSGVFDSGVFEPSGFAPAAGVVAGSAGFGGGPSVLITRSSPVFGSISIFRFVSSCSTMLNSTRRFFSRPSSVSLSAMGFV